MEIRFICKGFEVQKFFTTVSYWNSVMCITSYSIRIVLLLPVVNMYDYHGAYVIPTLFSDRRVVFCMSSNHIHDKIILKESAMYSVVEFIVPNDQLNIRPDVIVIATRSNWHSICNCLLPASISFKWTSISFKRASISFKLIVQNADEDT